MAQRGVKADQYQSLLPNLNDTTGMTYVSTHLMSVEPSTLTIC